MKILISLCGLVFSAFTFAATNPIVIMDTSLGDITLELYEDKAPLSVANFLAYIEKDGYQNTTFHRVISQFMIQGGGYDQFGDLVPTLSAIENESKNGLSNVRGTIAMARTNSPHSATRQFFINHKDNLFLDGNKDKWGYAVFGKVTSGIDIVDAIAAVKTGRADKPIQDIVINGVSVKN
jgi:peptidyl-prolyl cis-trans isomerase A (cyclophilin A)/peptidyl-prolyl cis-trans isomerase B (cyclophilin B)